MKGSGPFKSFDLLIAVSQVDCDGLHGLQQRVVLEQGVASVQRALCFYVCPERVAIGDSVLAISAILAAGLLIPLRRAQTRPGL